VKASAERVLSRCRLRQWVCAQLLSVALHIVAVFLIFVRLNAPPSNDGALAWVFVAPKGGDQQEKPQIDTHLVAPVPSSVVLTADMLDALAASGPAKEPVTLEAGTMSVDVAGCQLRIQPDDGVQITKAMQVYHAVLGFAVNRDQVQLQYAYRFEDGAPVGPISRDGYFAVQLRYPSQSAFVKRFRSNFRIPESENVVFALFPLEFDADLRELVRKKLIQAGRAGTAEEASVSFSQASPMGYAIASVLLRSAQ
jgi:hypothetical protein